MQRQLLNDTKRLIGKYRRNYCNRKYEAEDLICDIQNRQTACAVTFEKQIADPKVLKIFREVYGNYSKEGLARPIQRVIGISK